MRILEKNFSFGKAFDTIKETKTMGMRLPTWSEDVVIRVQHPNNKSKMTAPYLYVESRYGRVPWKETMIEMFSNEWQIVTDIDNDPSNTKKVPTTNTKNTTCDDIKKNTKSTTKTTTPTKKNTKRIVKKK